MQLVSVELISSRRYTLSKFIVTCYTPSAAKAPQLFNSLTKYMLDPQDQRTVFIGDFNSHNPDWLVSSSPLDTAGMEAQQFAEAFGLDQFVKEPTRKGNTLDLVLSQVTGTATVSMSVGSSDHSSLHISFQAAPLPVSPEQTAARNWARAPWSHIRGALKRSLHGYDPRSFDSAGAAADRLDSLITEVLDKYVKMKLRSKRRHTP